MKSRLTVAALLLLLGLLAISSVREKSNTFDELAHLTAGYSYWLRGDYRLHPENGVLPQRWAALPLLLQELHFPAADSADWRKSQVWKVGDAFFFQLGNDLDAMLLAGRGMIILLAMALGAVVYAWSRRLFGPVGALISLVAYVFCPTILAHGPLVTSDMAASLAFVGSLGCFWIVLHRVSFASVLASALAMGLLFVAKMSAVVILPVALILLVIRLAVGRPLLVIWRGKHVILGRWRQLAVFVLVLIAHAVVVAAVIWLMFGFRYATFRDAESGRDQMFGSQTVGSLAPDSLLGDCVRVAHDYCLLPQPYLHGFAFTLANSARRRAFLNGEHDEQGWRMFFVYCLLWKTPLSTLALLLAAAVAVPTRWFEDRQRSRRADMDAKLRLRRGVYRTLPLWVFLAVYWALAITSHLNIGHRHILPTYPVMFILCGAAGYWFGARQRTMKWLVVVAIVALVSESLFIYPNYLAYFNSFVGGSRNGYRHLVDSSLDWGQDLPGLKRWLNDELDPTMKDKPVYLSYFGTAQPDYYGLKVRRLPGYFDRRDGERVPLEPGTYCISATMLQGVYSMPPGNWSAENESFYQRVAAMINELAERLKQDPEVYKRLANDPQAAEELQQWNQVISAYNQTRLARLCAYLRLREPDDSANYSILIYYLDSRDLALAQHGTLEEWREYSRRQAE